LPIGGEDLVLNLEICDKIKSKEVTPKAAIGAIKRRLNHKNPNVQLLALKLLDIAVKNGGHHFLQEVASRDLMDTLTSLVRSLSTTHPDVRNKILSLLQLWGLAFKTKHDLMYVNEVYNTLKMEGIQFPAISAAETNAIMIDTMTVKSFSYQKLFLIFLWLLFGFVVVSVKVEYGVTIYLLSFFFCVAFFSPLKFSVFLYKIYK